MMKIFRHPLAAVGFSVVMTLLCCVVVFAMHVPNPMILLIALMVFFTFIGGNTAGAVSGLICVVYGAYFFSLHHCLIHFSPLNQSKMLVIIIAFIINFLVMRAMNDRDKEIQRHLEKANTSLALANAELKQQALYDPLTGAKNRAALRDDFELLAGRELVVIMGDIDHLKTYNDTYGHAEGDKVIRAFTNALIHCWGHDTVYRTGGDEFLVITDSRHPLGRNFNQDDFMENFRSKLEEPISRRLTGSFGCVTGFCKDISQLRAMIQQADENLYKAKANGRNNVYSSRWKQKK